MDPMEYLFIPKQNRDLDGSREAYGKVVAIFITMSDLTIFNFSKNQMIFFPKDQILVRY